MRSTVEYARLARVRISPDVLRAAASDSASPTWAVVWEQSCHQGTCHPDSAALLPWLAETIAGFVGDQREKPLALAGFIAVDAANADRTTFANEIKALRALAVDRLPQASDDAAFVYLLQAICGLEGNEVWGKELDRLIDGEADVHCPECDEETLVDLLTGEPEITPGSLSERTYRLHAEAVSADRGAVAAGLARLFGRMICPECGAAFDIADNLAGVSRP